MSDFYQLDDNLLEVEEPLDDSFEVFEDEEPEEHIEVTEPDIIDDNDVLLVEDPDDNMAIDDGSGRVPGSDAEFVQYSNDEPKEERESDWETDKDPTKFIIYIKDKLTKIPRHSGQTIPGCERAVSYLKSLENEASKAMRADFNGVIDEEELDKVRKDIDNMIFRLENHIQRLEKNASQSRVRFMSTGECDSCGSTAPMWVDPGTGSNVCVSCDNSSPDRIEKTAGTAVVNVYMTPFERSVIATCINAVVSGGKNINEVFSHMDKKYKFTDREKLAFTQLLTDHGYPVYIDRGRLDEDEAHPSDGNGVDWQTNYPA